MSIPDFSIPRDPKTVTLTTGTNDVLATMGTLGGASGCTETAEIGIMLVSGTLTNFAAQCRSDPSMPWQSYLSGSADWTSSINYSQRSWSSTDPTALSVGQSATLCINTLGIPYWQFLGSGGAGSTVEIVVRPLRSSVKN